MGCWNWTGGRVGGYGRFRIGQHSFRAHRLMYALRVGPIPYGMVVRHACDNTLCVNPDHLLIGSQADNVRDRDERGRCNSGVRLKERTHCVNNHEFTAANTYVNTANARACRTCRSITKKARRRGEYQRKPRANKQAA